MKPKLLISRAFYEGRFDFAYIEQNADGSRSVGEPLTLKKFSKNMMIDTPTFSLDDEDIQYLMDELWVAGIRPGKRLTEARDTEHMNGEILWLRDVADHLMKRKGG